MADQGPSKVGGGQSLALATTTAAETSTPTSQNNMRDFEPGRGFLKSECPQFQQCSSRNRHACCWEQCSSKNNPASPQKYWWSLQADCGRIGTITDSTGNSRIRSSAAFGPAFQDKEFASTNLWDQALLASSGQFLEKVANAMVQKMPDQSLLILLWSWSNIGLRKPDKWTYMARQKKASRS